MKSFKNIPDAELLLTLEACQEEIAKFIKVLDQRKNDEKFQTEQFGLDAFEKGLIFFRGEAEKVIKELIKRGYGKEKIHNSK